MKISGHRLLADDGTPFPFVQSPNGGDPLQPRWLVMHYTADGGTTAVDWFKNPASDASAHLVISRQGRVTQMMPFNRVCFHAGKSVWKGVSGLNRHSIGIEMVNYGELFRHPANGWMRYWPQGNGTFRWIGPAVPEAELMLDGERAVDGQRRPRAWQRYTDAQVEAAFQAARAIVDQYGLQDVVGHEEISPGRKTDPGPAFALAKFRERVMRRAPRPLFVLTTTLNIHAGPALTHPTVAAPLPQNTEVEELEDQGGWKRVAVRGAGGVIGWLPTTFLEAADLPAGHGG